MKSIIMLMFILLLGIAVMSCSTSEDCIKGKDKFISNYELLAHFDSVKFLSNGNLFISQGDENSITIETPRDISKKIKTNISDNVLTIDCNEEFCSDVIKIYLTMKEITSIRSFKKGNIYNITPIHSSSLGIFIKNGDFYMTNIDVGILKVVTNNQSNVKLSGSSKSTLLENYGNGTIEAKELNSKFLTVNIFGSSQVKAYVDYKLTTKIEGSGNLFFYGEPYSTDINRVGLGNIFKIKSNV